MARQTPQFWTRLFKWLCSEDYFEELQGDLEESFLRNIERHGLKKARQLYGKEVIKMVRPSVLNFKWQNNSGNHFSLFQLHLILALRNIGRNKVFSLVNILGLGAAIAVCIFMLNILYTGYSLDRQHQNHQRIFRITTQITKNEDFQTHYATTAFGLYEKIREELPDLESLTQVKNSFSPKIEISGSEIGLQGYYTQRNFFDIFSFPTLSGNIDDVFRDINSIAITASAAQRLFGGESPLGKVTTDGHVIRAVIESPKGKSHFDFEVIGNIEAYELRKGELWQPYSSHYLYIKLLDGSSPEQISQKLEAISKETNNISHITARQHLRLQHLTSIAFTKNRIYQELSIIPDFSTVYIFGVLITIMLFMACFNYANLSMARAIQRTKEIGIRKVNGSTRWQIAQQFLAETMIFAILGYGVGLTIFYYFAPFIGEVVPELQSVFMPLPNSGLLVILFVFSLITGVFAGISPSIYFSKISPLALFRSKSKGQTFNLFAIRKIIIFFQLSLSAFVLFLVMHILNHNKNLINEDLGANKENIIVIEKPGKSARLLINELKKIPAIEALSLTSNLPGMGLEGIISINDSIESSHDNWIYVAFTDSEFGEVFQPKMVNGEFFSANDNDWLNNEAVISKSAAITLGLDPKNAVGSTFGPKNQYQVKGVLDDLIMAGPYDKSQASYIILRNRDNPSKLVTRLNGINNTETISAMSKAWERIYPEQKFEPRYFNNLLKTSFEEVEAVGKVFGFLGFCIISIAFLGQFGLAVFTAENKIKEIGIRKVLGASTMKICLYLNSQSLKTTLLAGLVASPLAFLVFGELVGNASRLPIQFSITQATLGLLSLCFLLVGVISTQTWKTARKNPSTTLRNE
ncbi:ABC transporter permease [Roseivirga sp.]|uniref:ABC transporter permease n=1 Tax=Roseivirga sp. TaxID=1964215 RepID=UPI003B518F8F